MCNRYNTPTEIEIERHFRIGRQNPNRWWEVAITPLALAPYIKAGGVLEVGQWGMIPPRSTGRTPLTSQGRRMSTNNARIEGIDSKWTFRGPWRAGQRCLIPALSFTEPNWESGRNVWWSFSRSDGKPWALGGLWSQWADPDTGELVPNFTMLTQNCNAHSLLNRMHKPELDPETKAPLPLEQQDKRTVVPIEEGDWDQWLNGTVEQAGNLIRLPGDGVVTGEAEGGIGSAQKNLY